MLNKYIEEMNFNRKMDLKTFRLQYLRFLKMRFEETQDEEYRTEFNNMSSKGTDDYVKILEKEYKIENFCTCDAGASAIIDLRYKL